MNKFGNSWLFNGKHASIHLIGENKLSFSFKLLSFPKFKWFDPRFPDVVGLMVTNARDVYKGPLTFRYVMLLYLKNLYKYLKIIKIIKFNYGRISHYCTNIIFLFHNY